MCGESWHAIEDSLTHRSVLKAGHLVSYLLVCNCVVCVCVCTWAEDGGWRVTSGFLFSVASML